MAISSHTKWLRFLNLLFSIVILVLAGKSFTMICTPADHLDRKFYLEILDNWKRPSIYGLSSVSGSESCDFGYEEVTFSTMWPGTVAGCYCKSGGALTVGSCSTSELAAGCSTVNPTQPFYMNNWRDRKLCILRAGTSVYWAPSPINNTCPSKTDIHGNVVQFTLCGTGDVAVCQESTLGCPINRVQLINSSGPKPNDLTNYVLLGGDYVLYYGYGNSTSTQAPIIDFAISEGSQCLQDPGDDGTPHSSYYSLLSTAPNQCQYTDGRFIDLDSMDEVSFYQFNNLQNVSNMSGLVLDPSISYHLSYRYSILWKGVCHSEYYYSMNTLNDNKSPFEYIYNLHLTVLIAESIIAAYFVIVDPLLLYFCYKRAEEEINEYDQPLYTILMVEKFLKIILLPIVLVTCIVVAYYRNWFYNLEERCCSDPTTNASFGFVDYILDDLYSLDWANFSVIVVVLIVDMISGLCVFVSRTKENFSS